MASEPTAPRALRRDRSTTITESVSALLTRVGVPAACFDAQARVRRFCTKATFARHLRPFNHLDPVKAERMLRIGIDLGLFESVSGLHIDSFLNFLKLIKLV